MCRLAGERIHVLRKAGREAKMEEGGGKEGRERGKKGGRKEKREGGREEGKEGGREGGRGDEMRTGDFVTSITRAGHHSLDHILHKS